MIVLISNPGLHHDVLKQNTSQPYVERVPVGNDNSISQATVNFSNLCTKGGRGIPDLELGVWPEASKKGLTWVGITIVTREMHSNVIGNCCSLVDI